VITEEGLKLRAVYWEGDSLKVLRTFPDAIRGNLGHDLFLLQQGKMPLSSRPMVTIGPSVFELKDSDERAWYRLIYYTQVKERIYVLHVFGKKSRKTSKTDLRTAGLRLKKVQERLRQGRV